MTLLLLVLLLLALSSLAALSVDLRRDSDGHAPDPPFSAFPSGRHAAA